jgi:hypothetical protein
MGTLLAETSSKTFRLMAYNRTSDILRLSSISLREGAESGFRMNVDGMVGTEFTNASRMIRCSSLSRRRYLRRAEVAKPMRRTLTLPAMARFRALSSPPIAKMS